MPAAGDGAAQTLAAEQDALAAYIRDPERVAPPAGIEPRRLKIYRELFFNNVESLLANGFPVIRKTIDSIDGDAGWERMIRAFFREHGSRTPLFPELPREFMRWLEARAERQDAGEALDPPLPPWLQELAHYEWVELALQLSDASPADIAHDPEGDLLEGRPLLSPLAWPLAYAWPVHQLGPDHLPEAPPELPTLLLLRREPDGSVSFHALTPLTFRLLQRLDEQPALSGREQLLALAFEAGAADAEAAEAFLGQGAAMLAQMRAEGTISGTRQD
jgi:uncharacterized protein